MNIIKINNNQFQLNTQNTSYVMHNENGVLCHTYYGKLLPECDHSYMGKRQRYAGDFQSNVSENVISLDNALLEYPAFGDGGITNPALEVLNADGTNFIDLRVIDYVIHKDKPAIDGLPFAYCEEGDKVETLVGHNKETIGAEVLAEEVLVAEPAGYTKEWKINGEEASLGVEKV